MEKLLRAVLAASRLNEVYRSLRVKLMRAVVAAAAGVVAGVFLIFALIWFDAALWFYVAPKLGSAIASLIAGGAFFAVTVIAAIVLTVVSAGGAPAEPAPPRIPSFGPGVPPDLLRDANHFVRRHQGKILMATALAGLVFGSSRRR
jgi:hypothetical protein